MVTPAIEVVNRHALDERERALATYVGRGTALGNPFKVKPYGPYERGTTIELYRDWLRERLAARDARVLAALNEIALRAERGEHVRLMCSCAPRACHADVVKELVLGRLAARAGSLAREPASVGRVRPARKRGPRPCTRYDRS